MVGIALERFKYLDSQHLDGRILGVLCCYNVLAVRLYCGVC